MLKNRAQKPIKLTLETDQVLAFPCVSWPREAEGWQLRKRHSGWPSESLISDIIADGCLIVPVPYDKSPEEETEWRFSFSWAESKLALSLTDTQRQCYLLLKCLLQDSLALPKVLKSYHLKNILFWACEDIPATQWTHDNLALLIFPHCRGRLGPSLSRSRNKETRHPPTWTPRGMQTPGFSGHVTAITSS